MDQSVAARFWAKVDCRGPDECWEWQGAGAVYGVFWYQRRNHSAHRMSLLIATGEEPEMVCHTCDNKRCVNPAHLYAGDHTSNTADAVARNRLVTGTANNQSKLTPQDVREIRRRLEQGESKVSIGKRYSVSHSAVRQIAKGISWRHVA